MGAAFDVFEVEIALPLRSFNLLRGAVGVRRGHDHKFSDHRNPSLGAQVDTTDWVYEKFINNKSTLPRTSFRAGHFRKALPR